jgi:predicted phosphodiesterase
MRIGFLGDIHGNAAALEVCLKQLETKGVHEIYCLGDLVGWLPFGDRTLQRMRSLNLPTVAGNHDLMVAGVFTDHPDQLDRMQATAYNAGLLSTIPGALDYLLGLPLCIRRKGFTVVHHNPYCLPAAGEGPSIQNFGYLDKNALAASFSQWAADPCSVIVSGHDHIPAVYELIGEAGRPSMQNVRIHQFSGHEFSMVVQICPDSRYWIKAGSVGGPYRDGVPIANTIVYDDAEGTITLFRVAYPVETLGLELAAHPLGRNIPTLKKYVELLQGVRK